MTYHYELPILLRCVRRTSFSCVTHVTIHLRNNSSCDQFVCAAKASVTDLLARADSFMSL